MFWDILSRFFLFTGSRDMNNDKMNRAPVWLSRESLLGRGGRQSQNCKLSFFYALLYFYHCYCFSIYTRGIFSKDLSSDLSFLSVQIEYFIEFRVVYFCHRFSIVNSAIVELAKLTIFCIHMLYIITQNKI